MNVDHDLIRSEEAKRDRNWDPERRWRELQAAIAWADAQASIPRNSRVYQLQSQREKLRAFREDPQPT